LLAVKLCAGLPGDAASVEQVAAHHALGVAMFIGRSYAQASEASQRAIELAGQCVPPVDPFVLHSDLASAEVMRALSARSASQASTTSLALLAEHLHHCDALLSPAAPPAGIDIVIGGRANSIITYALCKAMLLVWQGDFAGAGTQVEALAQTVASSRRPWLEAVVQWARSELAFAEQDLPRARGHAQDMVRIALVQGHEGLAAIGLDQTAHLASTAGDHAAAAQALRELSEREQLARSASLRGRVADVERQLELRSRTRQLHASEAGRAHFQQLALEDGLTGLPNRRHFEIQLQALLDEVRSRGGSACLVMIDVDRFKQINDGHSHNVGDAVLQAIAELMRRCVRDKDFPARLAGDEFVIILRDTGLQAAQALTERLAGAVTRHAWSAIARGLSVSVSLGLAEILPTDTLRTVLSRSDHGMYANKREKAALR
jgi:diguanylate cyclase (GGDEF)-like protein